MARHMTIEQLSYDGIVIDKIWVGYSSFRILPGCEDIPYVQTWKQALKKRTILTPSVRELILLMILRLAAFCWKRAPSCYSVRTALT